MGLDPGQGEGPVGDVPGVRDRVRLGAQPVRAAVAGHGIDGCEVVICLAVRRFLCVSTECAKVTFAEQVSGLTSRHARRTPAVTTVLEVVALALGGRAGARLTGRLAPG